MKSKVKRRALALALIVAMVLAVGGVIPTGETQAASTGPLQQNGEYYEIYTLADLWGMKALIEGRSITMRNMGGYDTVYDYTGSANPYAKFRLMNNIMPMQDYNIEYETIGSLPPSGNEAAWDPIVGFRGTFEGGGHTITGLSEIHVDTRNMGSGAGFFSTLEGATVQDVNFDSCAVVADTSSNYAIPIGSTVENIGILAGSVSDSTVTNIIFTNCTNEPALPSDASNPTTVENAGIFAGSIEGSNNTISGITIDSSCSVGTSFANNNIKVGNSLGKADSDAVNGVTPPTPTPTPTPTPPPTPTPAPPVQGDILLAGSARYLVLGDGTVGFVGLICRKVTNVELPDAVRARNGDMLRVTRILKGAFSGCQRLKTVKFGAYVEVVEANAFRNCVSLKSFVSSPVLKTIEKYGFYNCIELTAAKLPTTMQKIGDGCFRDCWKLKEAAIGVKATALKASYAGVELPIQETMLDYQEAVPGCSEDMDDYREGVPTNNGEEGMLEVADVINITIGASVFANCSSLRKVIINCQVQKIGNSVFSMCKKLVAIIVYSKQLKTVGKKALNGVHDCRISVPKIKLKPYRSLFRNRGQGKKVVVVKL